MGGGRCPLECARAHDSPMARARTFSHQRNGRARSAGPGRRRTGETRPAVARWDAKDAPTRKRARPDPPTHAPSPGWAGALRLVRWGALRTVWVWTMFSSNRPVKCFGDVLKCQPPNVPSPVQVLCVGTCRTYLASYWCTAVPHLPHSWCPCRRRAAAGSGALRDGELREHLPVLPSMPSGKCTSGLGADSWRAGAPIACEHPPSLLPSESSGCERAPRALRARAEPQPAAGR